MNELIVLVVVSAISFWGSIQLGPVNVCVIQTALNSGKKSALLVAAGGTVPEFIYAIIAIAGTDYIERFSGFMYFFKWSIVVLLLILGIYYLLKPNQVKEIPPGSGASFTKGFSLAMMNPQLLPFWIAVLIYLKDFVDLESGDLFSPYISFVLGTGLGAFLILYTFTHLAIKYRNYLSKVLKNNLNKWVGILFILLACVELGRRLYELYG
ncbi:MAG: LysE family transporter [Flavobacteriales bacterium]|nr:LysE family transporter [Flavobacteriales bacterium]